MLTHIEDTKTFGPNILFFSLQNSKAKTKAELKPDKESQVNFIK